MIRKFLFSVSVVCLVLGAAGTASAQQWPTYPNPLERGPGNYLAWYKLLAIWLVFAAWVRTTDWVNHDTLELGDSIEMPAKVWNPIVVFPFLVAFLLAITIPIFFVGYPILILAYIVPLITYILIRNGRVTDEQKVLTPAHIKQVLADLASGKKKRKKDNKGPQEGGPPVKLTACGGSDTENKANLIIARQSPGYVLVKEFIAEMVEQRAMRAMLDFTKEAVAVRFDIDGVWHAADPREREPSDVMLAVMKKLANLNIEERRARQEGHFRAKYQEGRYLVKLVSQGTKTGERVVVELEDETMPFSSLEDLGMREKMRDELKEILAQEAGMVVFSALPAGGLQTTWNIALSATDRYMRDFLGIEEKNASWTHVENIELFTFDASAGETAETIMRKVLLREPDALVIPEPYSATIMNTVTKFCLEEKKLVVVGVRARDAIEALLRILAVKTDPEPFAQAVTAVVGQRLVRKLCETCRQAYEPPKQLLAKLGIPEGTVDVLYKEYQPPPPGTKKQKGEPEICPDCRGIGYRGRTAIFELVKISDEMRVALARQPRLDLLRKLSRKAGNRTLQEEGILLVVQGVTSLTELQRVLKQ